MASEQLSVLRSHCPFCGRELSRHERFAGGVCTDWQCRRHRTDAANRALRESLERQAAAESESAAARHDNPALREAPLVVVRWYQAGLEPVPEAQRKALRQHLMSLHDEVEALLAAATATPSEEAAVAVEAPQQHVAEPAERAAVDALLGQVCACCTGYCCQVGNGRHAFLDAKTLLRARLASPGSSHADIVDAYLAAVAPLHFARSCAFHSEHGCVMPRSHRADICNEYECDGLLEARGHAEESGVRRVYVIRHGDDQAPVGAFAPPADETANG